MNLKRGNNLINTILIMGIILLGLSVKVNAQEWPEIFNPLVLRTLYLEISPLDWSIVQNDETFDVEVPALFWMEEDSPIQISVRRKSGDPLNSGSGFTKVSLKLDINEFVTGQEWYGLKKLSLENGDDQDIISEGLGWYLHRVASGLEGYEYNSGLASWIRLIINDVDTGVYLSVEQRDKKFLENRGIYLDGETWLYKVSDIGNSDLKVGGSENSLTYDVLCYQPFQEQNEGCTTPPNEIFTEELNEYINMRGLLTLGAITTFTSNPDAIFSHGKNFYYADFLSDMKRLYFPWDLDSDMGGGGSDNIYQSTSEYSSILLEVPEFRSFYSQIMNELICGPLSQENLFTFMDVLEPILSESIYNDQNNQIEGSIDEHFDNRRQWLSDRIESVKSQIEGYIECEMNNDCGSGDMNTDSVLNVLDIVNLVNVVLSGGSDECIGDMNGDGILNVLDVVALVNAVLNGNE